MGDLKIYDANEVSMVVANIPIESGYADGEFLTVESESNAFEWVVGTDGEVTRSKTNDKRATITVKLMQTSSSNGVLSTLHNLDQNAPNGAGVGTLLIRDKQGTSLYTAAKCWIAKRPNATFDKTATSREWLVHVADLKAFDGGN